MELPAKVYTVRQRKTVPDASRGRWAHWFRKFVYLPFNQWCWRVMGIEPVDYPRTGGWSEGQRAFFCKEDAWELMRQKGPGWYIEELPLDGCLPDASCTTGDQVFPIGAEMHDNRTDALPIAVPIGPLIDQAKQLESMLAQVGRMLHKNQTRARSA